MSEQEQQRKNDTRPLESAGLRGPAASFAAFCEVELERRRNSDEPFDEALFREAMEMTLRRLQSRGEEATA
ncbi:MAG TPA: hypothetical protein ENK50_08490 [Sedimenticola sp.]|nr:hypothetical protein [Sedimenticola sp.]